MNETQFSGVIEYVETLRSGSFTAAGERLGLTGSAVGKSVTRLEKKLGTKLLHRTTRNLTPTPEGQRYFDGWIAILDEIDSLEQGVVAGSIQVSGRLNVHLPAAFGRRHVMPLLLGLTKKYPNLDLAVAFSEKRINLVDEGVDLVVRIGTLEDDADLIARRLGRQRLVVCASPDYLKRRGTPKLVTELTEHDCIVGGQRSSQPAWLFRHSNGESFSHIIHGRYCFSDGDAMLSAVLDGMGVSQLPTWLINEHLDSGALVTILEDYSGAEMPIHALWPRSRYLKPRQRVVIDALVEDAEKSTSIYQL
ncbi:LysR substrate-binding domain-containing protein [Vibrio mangrovi]|uniref:HTH-type transcriptional regulator DmlR n=1 Tax=Vibrio mangrovi TaxID=474394 RepID=A0A1Y6IXL2_9VIBR|nr:LysR substrate-binding domain-containing protein [Vibrio mangrovi]MDW6002886.1 LysR substrate-binding domain-containing protein [Vibrio mangrovi]SMS02376.1 HTH-type transcriptional regulator DmlR [Vibrio mangrovi]